MFKYPLISLVTKILKRYTRGAEAIGGKENVRIADISFHIDEDELLDICFMYQISPEYKLIRPSENMRVTEPLDEDSIMMYEESF
ncbi:hypothetical protein JCGZ_22099 [Jatropha curcas]|uniref:Uncharacterized protein n=1 Tax=Jatropha curcas TaxID=180498 RepID=A0A067JVY6_JATCU|nr:hypothetical protein JCGZ_22099 [Jatropha curcas]